MIFVPKTRRNTEKKSEIKNLFGILDVMKRHRISFFGQKTGIILDSADWDNNFIYLRFLKKKGDDRWEKPSNNEGKNIKLNILEIIAIMDLFKAENKKWTTVHKFGQETTPITAEKRGQNFILTIPGYQKYCNPAETKYMETLLIHIFEEKIIYATGFEAKKVEDFTPLDAISQIQNLNQLSTKNSEQFDKLSSNSNFPNQKLHNSGPKNSIYDIPSEITSISNSQSHEINVDPIAFKASLQKREDFYLVPGEIIAKSKKAVAFQIKKNNSTWVPLSLIDGLDDFETINALWIKEWFIDKKISDMLSVN